MMHYRPDREPNADAEAADKHQKGSADGPGAMPPSARPSPKALDAALVRYRQDLQGAEGRNALLLLLYATVAHQAQTLIARQFGSLRHREDELVLRTLARIEGRRPDAEGAQGVQEKGNDETAQVALLADYEFRPDGRSIHGYVLQKTRNIARNMQSEAYLPDGGFWSTDLVARFKVLASQRGQAGLPRSGAQIEVPIASADEDNDGSAASGPVPAALQFSETPLRHSVLRVNSLAGKLNALGQQMVGQTLLVGTAQNSAETRPVRLTLNHQRIWRAWLGLSHPELIDLSEEELATALGISKATATRDTSAGFAYMLQHADLRSVLVLMAPNRFQGGARTARQHDAQLDELENALRGPNGKRFFRKCVHQWLGEHI